MPIDQSFNAGLPHQGQNNLVNQSQIKSGYATANNSLVAQNMLDKVPRPTTKQESLKDKVMQKYKSREAKYLTNSSMVKTPMTDATSNHQRHMSNINPASFSSLQNQIA